jgi:transitional endoplasmic reticulum ATPase
MPSKNEIARGKIEGIIAVMDVLIDVMPMKERSAILASRGCSTMREFKALFRTMAESAPQFQLNTTNEKDGTLSKSINEAAEEKKTKVAEVVRSGSQIMIPDDMSLEESIKVLTAKQTEEEQVVALSCRFDAFIWEGAYAMARALDKKFGWFEQMKVPGSFFEPEEPPALYSVQSGPLTTVSVPWGRFRVPGIKARDGYMATGFYKASNGMISFQLDAQVKRKHSRLFDAVCDEIKVQLKTGSLYKGKAISIKFRDSDGQKIKWPEPTFPVIGRIGKDQLIFSKHIEMALNANLYTPITKTAQVRAARIPLKRGVLLAGPYGTGKTLIATLTANLAAQNNWTFLFCQRSDDFPDCVRFAQQYQPAVVFCEDIDRVTDGDRNSQMDELLNTIDGVNSKSSEVILVLTTNEVENIHQGMLRPGRLDAVIAVERPDAEAVERLIRHYGAELIDPDEDLLEAGKLLAGTTPSVIREVVDRAKLTAISLTDDPSPTLKLSVPALVNSAHTMKMQLDLLSGEKRKDPHAMEIFGKVVAENIVAGVQEALRQAPSVARQHVAEVPEAGKSMLITSGVGQD